MPNFPFGNYAGSIPLIVVYKGIQLIRVEPRNFNPYADAYMYTAEKDGIKYVATFTKAEAGGAGDYTYSYTITTEPTALAQKTLTAEYNNGTLNLTKGV